MKKRVISAILCGMMAASLLGTVAFADETKTFTVGFDAEYPPYGYMESTPALIWSWLRQSVIWKAGSL